MNKRISIKRIFLSLIVCILTFSFMNITVMAAGSNFQLPSFLDRYDVYSGGSNYTPNLTNYPFNKSDVTSIGFDKLYNYDKSFFEYKGEVPSKIADEDYAKKYRTYDGNEIDGKPRPWSDTSISDNDLKPQNTDPHIWAMTVSHSFAGFGSIFLAIIRALNWLFSMIVDLMITFKSFNIGSLVTAIDSSGTFAKQISQIFLIDPKTGSMSPFLIFGVVSFIISLISISFGFFKGKTSGRTLINEFGFLIIALVITGMFFSTSNVSKVSKIGINFMDTMANDITSSASSSTVVFNYSTEDSYVDNSATQKALINKTYIDQLINAQFGYSVSDLYLINPDGSNGSFGTKNQIQDAMKKTFGDQASAESMTVCIDSTGEKKINNLGYWLWAANSGVQIYDGTSNTSPAFYTYGDKTLVRTGSSDRTLYVVDFLSNLRAIHKDAKNDAMVAKIDTIMKHLTSPSYISAVANVFVVTIQNACLAYGLFCVAIFAIIGQLIIVLGSYCMVVMPTLLLFNATRSTAKRMTWTYLLGFLRYLIGSALFDTIIIISTLMSQQGFMGIIASAVICFLLGKFGPNLMEEINTQLTQFGRGKELRMASDIYNKIGKGFRKHNAENRAEKNKNALILNEDGEIEKVGSMKERIQEGIKKGENPFNSESGINPFGKKRKEYNERKKEQMEEDWDSKQKADNDFVLNENEEQKVDDDFVLNEKSKDSDDFVFNQNEKQKDIDESNINSQRSLVEDDIVQSGGLGGTVIEDEEINDIVGNKDYSNNFDTPAESEIRQDGRSLLGEETDNVTIDNEEKEVQIADSLNRNIFNDFIDSNNTVDNIKVHTPENTKINNQEIPEVSKEQKTKEEKTEKRNLNLKNSELKTADNEEKEVLVTNSLNKNMVNGLDNSKNIVDNIQINKPKNMNTQEVTKVSQQQKIKEEKEIQVVNSLNKNVNDFNNSNNNVNNIETHKPKNTKANTQKIPEVSQKQKIKEEKAEKRNLKLKNTGLKAVNKVPLVDPTLNQHIANKMAQPARNKKELKETMERKVVESEGSMTVEQAYNASKNEILSKTTKTSQKSKIKTLEKARDSIGKKDAIQIRDNAKLKLKKKQEAENTKIVADYLRNQNKKENGDKNNQE